MTTILGRMMRVIFLAVLLACPSLAAAEAPGNAPEPAGMVRETLRSLASLVSDCRLQLAADPVALRGVIDRELRPRADVLYAAQLIMGRHWAGANPEQRRRFADALYGSLTTRYASGLLLLTRENVSVAPGDARIRNGEASVELRVSAGLASPVSVFLQLRRSDDRWRAYDARWEGQSYVLSLRREYAQEINHKGLDKVISALESTIAPRAEDPASRATPAGRCLRARLTR